MKRQLNRLGILVWAICWPSIRMPLTEPSWAGLLRSTKFCMTVTEMELPLLFKRWDFGDLIWQGSYNPFGKNTWSCFIWAKPTGLFPPGTAYNFWLPANLPPSMYLAAGSQYQASKKVETMKPNKKNNKIKTKENEISFRRGLIKH